MSKAQAALQAEPCTVLSFAELSCYDAADNPRQFLAPVTFRLFSVGRSLGSKLDVSFVADYGLYYGLSDEPLLEVLCAAAPAVDWRGGNWVFHRWLDQSRIQVLHGDTGKIAAQIETRRYEGRRVSHTAIESGEYGARVITLDQCRQIRIEKAMVKLSAEREDAVADQEGGE